MKVVHCRARASRVKRGDFLAEPWQALRSVRERTLISLRSKPKCKRCIGSVQSNFPLQKKSPTGKDSKYHHARKRALTTTTFHVYGSYGRVRCLNLIAVHRLCPIASCAWLGASLVPGRGKAILQRRSR